jgi:hypothetical protein
MIQFYVLPEIKSMQTENIKEKARRILDTLPEQASWDDLMYRIYVRQTI